MIPRLISASIPLQPEMSGIGLTLLAMNEQPARHNIMITVGSNGSHRPGLRHLYRSSQASRINREINAVISTRSADKLIAWSR